MKLAHTLPIVSALLLSTAGMPAQAAEGVIASIKPVHSIVSAIMQGAGEPALIVKGAASPHAYSMRPSEAASLESAKIVFWVGPELESFLEKPLETLGQGARIVELSHASGLTELKLREGGPFEAHEHEAGEHEHEAGKEDHGHEDHAAHEDHDDHHEEAGHEEHAEVDHADEHHDHDHGEFDMHLWLDPENARAMANRIAGVLAESDPANSALYRRNLADYEARLDDLITETDERLASVRGKPFIVFHDAYQYYENRFDIPAAGSITVSPETIPGARRVGEIHDKVEELGAACVFSEPQFEPKLVEVVTEGTQARAGVLDPLGASLEDGPELYFELVDNMTASLVDCLSGQS
ncbi:zinc ABC transporter substrate-binding protein ZnuA [Nitratireductor luteus]|uniref:zinc ABC transporter substrate-binding protein ZnuA n=1 Tax=Nitratireductor luteus TaxID=2976980 RepID=UPI00223F27B4|nr:zinc ABC transporter substrate-binding protein ZnuA [Nitratireductor luteus]